MANHPSARLTALGETLSLRQWERRTGIPARTIAYRVREGWSAEDAVSRYSGQSHDDPTARQGQPFSASWRRLSWVDDHHAWYAVACHPDGLALAEVGQLMGLNRERVRQIEASAIRKLRKGLERVVPGGSADVNPAWLGAIFHAHDERRRKEQEQDDAESVAE